MPREYREALHLAVRAGIAAAVVFFFATGCATTEHGGPLRSSSSTTAPAVSSRQSIPETGDPEKGFRSAMDAFAAGDHEQAALLSRGVIEGHPDSPWSRRSLFLLGKTFIARNMTAEAEETLVRVAAEYPDFADYALFGLAEHLRSRQRLVDAAALLQRLVTHYPTSLLVPRSLAQRGQALAEAGYSQEAAEVFGRLLREYPRSDAAPDAALGLGNALIAAGDPAAASRAFLTAKIKYPSQDLDQAADRGLAGLIAQGVEPPRMTADDLADRARSQYRTSQFGKAYESFTAALERDPAHPQKADILLKSGIALFNLGKRSEAATVLERLLKAKPPDCRCAETLHWLGKSYSRLNMREEAVRSFLKLVNDHPDSDWADDALYLAGNVHRDAGDMKKALVSYRRLTAEYPDSSFADSALWWEAWSAYGAGEYTRASRVLQEIVLRYPRSFLVNQALFWQGRAAEASGDSAAAALYYQRLLNHGPYTYYGLLAARRLNRALPALPAAVVSSDTEDEQEQEAAGDPEDGDAEPFFGDAPQAWTDEAIAVLSGNPSYRKTLELMFLGMKREAAAELWSLLELAPRRSGAVLGLSKAFFELGDYHSSIIVVLRNFDRLLERPSERVPEDLWLLAYPQGFWPSITVSAKRYGMDPYFVAAIIREESQFRPEALSPAGARGVMQVMPSTGEWVARNTGISGFERSMLFDADTNIRIGTWYLSYLMKRFGGNLSLVAAAYNAGPDPVLTWAAKSDAIADPATFVETIPYAETRGYVKKVLRNYAEYHRIYEGSGTAILDPQAGPAGTQLCRKNGGCP